MTHPLKVLMIEDSEDDAELILHELRRAGFTPESARVESRDGLKARLRDDGWEVVLADNTMPRFNAVEALKICREDSPHVPFIIVSGTLGEDVAVEAMKSGAQDYIMKGNLARLVPAINRALRESLARRKQREAELALRESQARLAGIIASAMDAIITTDEEMRIVVFNAAAEKMFRCPASEVTGERINRFIPERFRARHEEHVREFAETGVTNRRMGALGDLRGLRADGEEFPIEASISQISTDGKKYFTVILRDITERTRAEERIHEQAALLDLTTDAIIVRGLDDRIQHWNKGAERMYGWPAHEAIGRAVTEILYTDTRGFIKAKQAMLETGEWTGELDHVNREGQPLTMLSHWTLVRDENGAPKSVLTINTNITEKKRLESQLLRSQRMEAIGTLASGIAHDLNNILAPILMSASMLHEKLSAEEKEMTVASIESSAQRGADIVKQLLNFGRGFEGERIIIQPKHLIREMVKIARQTFPKDIEITFRLSGELWTIPGDPVQLHQVLLNLCVNARDAMPEGGELSITAGNVRLDEGYAEMNPEARPGPYLVLSVADTGQGIPADVLPRIFDPFFTTKEAGKGTGLGLSTVMGIVKSHGGFMKVTSAPGKGSAFEVYLPASPGAEEKPEAAPAPELRRGQGELVLVVDDEANIRNATRRSLENAGYTAVTAGDGVEALALFAQRRNDVCLVITDIIMPFMDGASLVRALKKMNPAISVIATSGISSSKEQHVKMAELDDLGVKTVLSKPFTTDTLLRAVDEMLHASKAPPGEC